MYFDVFKWEISIILRTQTWVYLIYPSTLGEIRLNYITWEYSQLNVVLLFLAIYGICNSCFWIFWDVFVTTHLNHNSKIPLKNSLCILRIINCLWVIVRLSTVILSLHILPIISIWGFSGGICYYVVDLTVDHLR